MADSKQAKGGQAVVEDKFYSNDRLRESVKCDIRANTFEEELRRVCHIQPISVEAYDTKVKRIQTVRKRINEYANENNPISQQAHNRHANQEGSSFHNRVISFFGQQKAALETDPTEVAGEVENFVTLLMKAVASKAPRFDGRLVACGSYYEGAKVKCPNEFDYVWELKQTSLSINQLEVTHIKPETFKPRKHQDIYGRSYFKLAFKNQVPHIWHCPSCIRAKSSTCVHRRKLLAREVNEDFRNAVQIHASHVVPEWKNAQVTRSGPAVTVYTQLKPGSSSRVLTTYGKNKLKKSKYTESGIDFFLIKIDITLAIRVNRSNQNMAWPMEGYGDLELDEQMIGHDLDIDNCQLVTAGDYWRVSFSNHETQLVHDQISNNTNKKNCFVALKYMRDHLALTDDHESGLLSTYPLKVTFLKENKFTVEQEWTSSRLAERTQNILKEVEQNGIDGKLTSYFIKNDPLLMESDRSYIESRRIRQYLDKMAHHYRINGYTHMGILILFLLCHILLIIFTALYLDDYRRIKDTCSIDGIKPRIELGQYIFSLLPLSFSTLLLAFVGLFWIIINKWFLQSSNVLYDMYQAPIYAYGVFVVLGLIQSILAVRLGAGFSNLFDQCSLPADLVPQLSTAVCSISATLLGLVFIHSFIFVVWVRKKFKYYSWELIFCDDIYKEIGSALRHHFRRTDDTSPPLPNRVLQVSESPLPLPRARPRLTSPSPVNDMNIADDDGLVYEEVDGNCSNLKVQYLTNSLASPSKAHNLDDTSTGGESSQLPVKITSSNAIQLNVDNQKTNERPKPKPAPKPRARSESPPPPLPPRNSRDTTPGIDNLIYSSEANS